MQQAPQSKIILEYRNKTEGRNKLHNSSDNLLNSDSNEREVVEDIIKSNDYKKILSSQLKNQLSTTTVATAITVPTTIEQEIVEDIIVKGDNGNSSKQVTANTDSNTSSSRIGSNHSSAKSSPNITTLQNDQQHNTAEETKKDDVYILEEDEDVKAFIELLRESQKKRRLTAPKCLDDIWDSYYEQRHEDTGDYMNLSYYSDNTVYYYKGDGTAAIEIKNPYIKTESEFLRFTDTIEEECVKKRKEGNKEYYYETYLLEHNLITKEDLAKKSPTGDKAREHCMARLIIDKYCRDI